MKLKSITTKFILIISILMALVLGIQFYFTNQTHEDILAELDRLRHSINSTTDQFLIRQFEQNVEGDSAQRNSIFKNKNVNGMVVVDEDVAYFPQSSGRAKARATSVWVSGKSDDDRHIKSKKSKSGVGRSFEFIFSQDDKKNYRVLRRDSINTDFDVIDININNLEGRAKAVIKGERFFRKSTGLDTGHVLSFEFPRVVSTSQAPQRIRYNYNTGVFSSVLEDIRNRNLLITLSLFGLSILAISLIAGKFLKPIKSLNQSFDKVVQGDLDVSVDSKSNDEIGELSASFNHMVKELRKNKDKETTLNRQQRLASLGQLAAGVAHEIKNPLNAINLTIEHLSDKFISDKEEKASAYIQSIQKEIKRLDKTVNNFLSYLRSEKHNKKKADINILFDEIFTLYERELTDNRIKVDKKYSAGCMLYFDEERFKTVIMNLVINAIQAMPDGGEITIETDAELALIKISDSGTGIPAKNLENIFDLFYTTKSAGTGLGLPTASRL